MIEDGSLFRADRSGEQEPIGIPEPAAMLEQLLAERSSCRGYLPDPVPRQVIVRMLEMAQRSASWCNSQPWQVIVTEGAGTERLREALFAHMSAGGRTASPDLPFPAAYRGIYKERQREVGWKLYESVGVKQGDREGSGRQAMENFRFFGAPHALILTSERDLGTYGAIDCGIYVGSLTLAAQSLGLGIIAQAALAGQAPFLRSYLDIPDNRTIVLGASFGYADAAHPANSFRAPRADLGDVVHWVTR